MPSHLIQTVTFDGAVNNGTRLGFQVPVGQGGITIVQAKADLGGTASFNLVTLSNAGTPAANGTVSTAAVGGTVTAGIPRTFVIDSDLAYVPEGYWVGVKEMNLGTPSRAVITVNYVVGK